MRVVPTDEMIAFLANQWVIDLRELEATPDAYQNMSLPEFLRAAGVSGWSCR